MPIGESKSSPVALKAVTAVLDVQSLRTLLAVIYISGLIDCTDRLCSLLTAKPARLHYVLDVLRKLQNHFDSILTYSPKSYAITFNVYKTTHHTFFHKNNTGSLLLNFRNFKFTPPPKMPTNASA